jgi:serine/threonine-protein kinase
VAIKFLLPELVARPEILRRFENEAVAAGGLEHPNLVAVIDVGRASDGTPYLVMEFLRGEDCARLLRDAGPLPVARAVNIVLQACRGVAAAHDAGIIHRDLKPENLFLTDAGDGGDQLKVLDFGIAKLRPEQGQAATRTGSTFGTTHYMSPEQARGAGEVDPRTDVWSLGVVLYELLGGRKPFDAAEPLGVVHQILNATPPALESLRPGLPRGLLAVVEKAMRKDVAQRYPSIRAFASAVAPFAGRAAGGAGLEPTSPTNPSPPTTGDAPPRGRGRGLLAGTGLAMAGVALGIVTMTLIGKKDEPAPRTAAPSVEAPPPAAVAPLAPVVAAPPAPPAPPAPAVAKVSEPSGQSEPAVAPAEPAATPATDRAARRGRVRPVDPTRVQLKLDPNPY